MIITKCITFGFNVIQNPGKKTTINYKIFFTIKTISYGNVGKWIIILNKKKKNTGIKKRKKERHTIKKCQHEF